MDVSTCSNTDAEIFFYRAALLKELERITSTAFERNIRIIPLKGAAMAISGHNQSRVRPMTDIDILIQECDINKMQQLLLHDGYIPLPCSKTSFVKESVVSVVFDIHTSLRFISSKLNAQLWMQTVQADYNGMAFELLPLEINIIYLCLHMTITHGYASEKWINDIENIAENYSGIINWKLLADYAVDCNAAAPVFSVLKKIDKYHPDLIPGNIFSELNAFSSRWKIQLFTITLQRKHGLPLFDYIAPVLLTYSLSSVAQVIRYKLFPPLVDMKKRYNTSTLQGATIYYPVRICSLFFKAIFASISALFNLIKHRVFSGKQTTSL